MKCPALCLLSFCLAACSALPGLQDPRVFLVPQVALMRFDGDASLRSPPTSGSTPIANPKQTLDTIGLGGRDENVGGLLRFGDEFSGVDLGYLRVDNNTTDTGVLQQDFGTLMPGDTVDGKVDGDEFRLRYIAGLVDFETAEQVRVQFGLGGQIAHRNLKWRVQEASLLRAEQFTTKDEGVVYGSFRGDVSYMGFGVRGDYSISPDIQFGGDFSGIMHDVEIAVTYTFADNDVVAVAGYRRTWLPARGVSNGLPYELDATMDGYVLGLEIGF